MRCRKTGTPITAVMMPTCTSQVGIMTAVIGVPVFLHLIRRGRIGAL